MKYCLVLVLFFLSHAAVLAQSDSLDFASDSLITTSEVGDDDVAEVEDDGTEQKQKIAPPDSMAVNARHFDEGLLKELKDDPTLRYQEPPTVGESLWQRFVALLAELFGSILDGAVSTNWGRVITFLIGFAVVIIVIIMLLRVNAFRMFYAGEGASAMKYNVLDENIHEMDFEKLIQEAMARNDHRTGVRLTFLYALKLLSDKNLIHWERGKTNHDYLAELKGNDVRSGFNELNYYFEYAWYGNFNINGEMFASVQETFKNWRNSLT